MSVVYDERLMSTKEWLIKKLQNEVLEITFNKVDGTERVMKCTLKSDVVVPYEKKTEQVKEKPEGLLSVWDIDKEAWRSMYVENVTHIREIPNDA